MPTPMLGILGGLLLIFSLAVTAAAALGLRARDRRRLLGRLAPATDRGESSEGQDADELPILVVETPAVPLFLRLAQGTGATAGVILAVLAARMLPSGSPWVVTALALIGAALGAMVPLALRARRMRRRQQQIRHALPDALDLLVVCVEAGVSLEMAIQRVGRELARAHPALAQELTDLSRRLAAGMPRDQAFQSIHLRTGVDDLRTVATHLLQSERWGTSIAAVLRTAAQDLRRRRRRAAEQRAATAATRMLAPLALCIFPTIFVVILGPAALRIVAAFRDLTQ